MRDPDRRDLWSVLRGRGTPSLRGLLTRVVVGVGLVLGVLSALAIIGVYASTASYRDDQQTAVTRASPRSLSARARPTASGRPPPTMAKPP